MPTAIFLSYRRKEGLVEARALYERLRAEFGRDNVFIDLEGIDYGVDFEEVLQEQLKHCQVLLALIGQDWVGQRPGTSQRRIDDEHDFVRMELRAGLARNIRVVPLLINGADMPHSEELPDDLKPLVRRQGLQLDFRRFDADVGRLAAALRKHISGAHAFRPSPLAKATFTEKAEKAEKAKMTGIRGQHIANVNTTTQSGSSLRDAIVSKLPDATNIQVIPAATLIFGNGADATKKFQYQLTFVHDRRVASEEFESIVGPLIVDLNTYTAPVSDRADP